MRFPFPNPSHPTWWNYTPFTACFLRKKRQSWVGFFCLGEELISGSEKCKQEIRFTAVSQNTAFLTYAWNYTIVTSPRLTKHSIKIFSRNTWKMNKNIELGLGTDFWPFPFSQCQVPHSCYFFFYRTWNWDISKIIFQFDFHSWNKICKFEWLAWC